MFPVQITPAHQIRSTTKTRLVRVLLFLGSKKHTAEWAFGFFPQDIAPCMNWREPPHEDSLPWLLLISNRL
jgi:hypothetical protein